MDLAPVTPLPPATWSTGLPDWEERFVQERSLVPDLPLRQMEVDRALAIFKALRMPDVAGHPTYGEACDPRVFDMVAAIFGAFDEEGVRRIKEYFWLLPKKNGKTSIAAAVVVVATLVNTKPNETALLIAPSINIANYAFEHAAGIIKLSRLPTGTPLEPLFNVVWHGREINYLNEDTPCTIAVRSADGQIVTGSKAGIVLVDEVHEFALNPSAEKVMVELRGGTSHPQGRGFLLMITTQSKAPPVGLMKAELRQARAVRDGERSAPMLPVLYEFPARVQSAGEWRNPSTWRLVNFHLGRSVDLQYLTDQYLKAQDKGLEAEALFASQHLNVEIGQGLHADRWPGAVYWPGAALPALTLDELIRVSEVCTVGIDGGGEDDLFGLSVIGRHAETKAWLSWSHAWCDPVVLQRRKDIATRIEDLQRAGQLTVCGHVGQDMVETAEICLRLFAGRKLPEREAIGLDKHGGALALIDGLAARGLPDALMSWVGQGYQLQPAQITLVRKMKDGTFFHGGQELMTWCVGNARQELRGSNYVITKQAAQGKIDPLVALFNAGILMLNNPTAAGAASYLDDAELMVL